MSNSKFKFVFRLMDLSEPVVSVIPESQVIIEFNASASSMFSF